jgi:hypothetical protein
MKADATLDCIGLYCPMPIVPILPKSSRSLIRDRCWRSWLMMRG